MLPATNAEAYAAAPARRHTTQRASLVQQKLQAALLTAEKTAQELSGTAGTLSLPSASLSATSHTAAKSRAPAVETAVPANGSTERRHADENVRPERAVVRYRQAAATVSFTDDASSFSYTPNFMPGVHFYTFLASKAGVSAKPPPLSPVVLSQDHPTDESSAPQPQTSRPRSAGPSRSGLASSRLSSSSASRSALRMWVPDTVVYGETGRAIWVYSDPTTGCVHRSTEFSDKQVLERFTAITASDDGSSSAERVIVFKEPIVAHAETSSRAGDGGGGALLSQGSQLRLLNLAELKTLLNNLSSNTRKSFAIQRFVRCSGAKAFVLRSVYESGKPAYAWMVSNATPMQEPAPVAALVPDAQSLETTASTVKAEAVVDRACTFVKLNERACATTTELTQRVVKHMEQRLGVQVQTLVADFTKDASGIWWLLQVKAFQIKNRAHPGRPISLPARLRLQYLGYRDSQLVEDGSDSDGEKNGHGASGRRAAALVHAHRQTRKLVQCKCCMAAYPKSELSFKMTLKMINDMLLRIRARAAPDAPPYAFLAPALARELPDASLAYESWSVCSFCYAIYERDQQLQRVEAKFSAVLGVPSAETARRGLSRVHEHKSLALDPSTSTAVLPAQLTLCRLLLVVNGLYDIPSELYDAETSEFPFGDASASSAANGSAPRSRLFLRITALGYTECVPIDAADIVLSDQRAPRGAAQRRASSALSISADCAGDGDLGDEEEADCEASDRRSSGSSGRSLSASQQRATATAPGIAASLSPTTTSDATRNYSLPLNLIRTMQFFAPRTPLQAKLKETSGITPFLTDANSIHLQLVRATDPPLEDSTTGQARRRPNNRRAALATDVAAATTGATAAPPAVGKRRPPATHSVVLGSTKIRMAQFQSVYVTKMDYYACMAFTGEMLNVKGNVGLERLRYVDTKLLTAQFRLRAHNGVFIPDEAFAATDPLSSEWMDCLRLSSYERKPGSGNGSDRESDCDDRGRGRARRRRDRLPLGKSSCGLRSGRSASRSRNGGTPLTGSTSSLMTADDEEMDQELELMIDRASQKQQDERSRELRGVSGRSFQSQGASNNSSDRPSTDAMRQQLLSSTPATPSAFDAAAAALMDKTLRSPRSALASQRPHDPGADGSHGALGGLDAANERDDTRPRLWTLVIHLNHAHHLVSREHAVCRWECSYSLFGQKRSAIERRAPASPSGSPTCGASVANRGVQFTSTHTFFAEGSRVAMRAFIAANARLTLQLRNDMYASTRLRRQGEFFGLVDLSRLLHAASFDATVDIMASPDAQPITPREAEAMASAGLPYLSLSVQLSDVAVDSEEKSTWVGRDFVEIGRTPEGLAVVRKIT